MKNIVIFALAVLVISSFGTNVLLYNKVRELKYTVVLPKTEEVVKEVSVAETGRITGKIGYPSDFLPQGKIIAKNITTKEEFSQSVTGKTMNYEFELPSGVYYLKYDTGIMSGYHSTFSRCHGVSDDCPRPGVLVAITVQAGKTVEGIDINDFYSNIEESLF